MFHCSLIFFAGLLALLTAFSQQPVLGGNLNLPPVAVTELRTYRPDTTLVDRGTAASLIVYPDQPAYAEVAREVADAIKQATGAEVPVKPASLYSEQDRATNLICLGRMGNNRLAFELYNWRLVVSDDWFPGPEGFELRTVPDPWGHGHNVIMLVVSDIAGVRRAAAAFTDLLSEGKTLVIPYTIRTHFKGIAHLEATADEVEDALDEMFAGDDRGQADRPPAAPGEPAQPAPDEAGTAMDHLIDGIAEPWIRRDIQRLYESLHRGDGDRITEPDEFLQCAEMYMLTGREEYAEAWGLMARDWMDSYYTFSLAAWMYRDPEYVWYVNWVTGKTSYEPEMTESGFERWLWSFLPKADPREPARHIGVSHAPVHKANYAHITYDSRRDELTVRRLLEVGADPNISRHNGVTRCTWPGT